MRHTDNRYGGMYRLEAPFGRYICVYCGDSAATVDHTPPLATLDMLTSSGAPIPDCVLVPACSECNRLLGDAGVFEVDERRVLVKRRLAAKYAGLLKTPDWSDEELGDLGPTLAATIRGDITMRDRVRERIGFLQ